MRLIVVSLSSALGVTAFAYAVDYLVLRHRVAANRQPFGQITVTRYDAILQKNGKTQLIFNPPEAQTCVHALFPRAGFLPCWYLRAIPSNAPTSENRDAARFFPPKFGYNGVHSELLLRLRGRQC